MNWYLAVIKNYFGFTGRARRMEYWMFLLFNILFSIVAVVLDNALGLTVGRLPYGVLFLFYGIMVFIPGLAVSVRRLHDIGKSGWMLLLGLIPIIGALILLGIMATEGERGENIFGPNPKEDADSNTYGPRHEEVLDENEYGVTSRGRPQYQIVSEFSMGDNIILVVVAWLLLSNLFWTVIPMIASDFYSSLWFETVNKLMRIIWAFVPLGLAFAVKDKSKKMIAYILGGVYLLHSAFSLVQM